MDPISQGTIGAAFAQSQVKDSSAAGKIAAVTVFGCLAGMAPDLDVFIQSSTDPLLFLEYHRHFTHALIFIPVGALIVSAVLFRLVRHPLTFRQAYLSCLIGYATHALLDSCTSYGTQLFWPFSNYRVAWNNVSVVDPFFTLPLLAMVVLSVAKQRRVFALAGICWALAYLLLGAVQLHRVSAAAEQVALSRGHEANRLTMKPSFGNLVLWKSIYEHQGYYYVDAIRGGLDTEHCPGERVEKLELSQHLPALDPGSQQAADIERFRWFSSNYLALYPGRTAGVPQIVDIRYSMVPNEVDPMWGIGINPQAGPQDHVQWYSQRNLSREMRNAFFALLAGDGCQGLWHDAQKGEDRGP